MVDSYGFAGIAYDQIIIFRSREAFEIILKSNPYMEAIVGGDDETRDNFPGVYIAGIISKHHRDWDKLAAHHTSTQK